MPTPQPSAVDPRRALRRPFVGRRSELDVLRGHLGNGGLIAVTGDPGIGKTRLAEEFATEAEEAGALVCWGRCWEGDGAPAFWAWVQVLRELRRTMPDSGDGDLARVLDDLEGRLHDTLDAPALDPAHSRFRLFDAVTTLLVAATATRPLVLVLEDLHWADRPSVALLQFVARHARKAPLLVLVTYRDVELQRTHALAAPLAELLRHGEPLPLAGLAPSDVERYVAATLGDERARTLAPRLHRESEGHPFFLVEMVRLLESNVAAALAGMPDGIRELIARRIRQRSLPCQEMLRVAAVVGRDFALPLLRRLSALTTHDVVALLDEALDARLVVAADGDPDGYRFGHALVREALYAEVPLAERIALHRQIAEAIEAGAAGDVDVHAAALAHHFREAVADGSGDPGPAVNYAIQAGDRATQALAHEEAVAHYERALQLLERRAPIDEARRVSTLIALGLAQVRTGDPGAADTTFTRAAALARELGLAEELARAALGIGEVARQSERVVPVLEEALATLEGGDSVLRARVLSRLAVALYWSQSEARKRALSDTAVAMARRLGYLPTLAYTLTSRIVALSGPDDVEERLAASQEIVTLSEQCDDRELTMVGHGWTIADNLALGDIHKARIAMATFTSLAEKSRHPYFVWWVAALRTMLALLEARYAEAETLAQECYARGQRAVEIDATQVFAGHYYVLCMESLRHDELEPLMHGVVAQFPDIPSGLAGLSLLLAERGRMDEAVAVFERLGSDRFTVLPRNPEWLTTMAALVQTSVSLPGAPHAATLYELLAPYRHRVVVSGMGVLVAGSVAFFLGTLATALGRFDEAESCLTEALAVHERFGALALRAYTQHAYAELALARRAPGDEALAARLVAEATHFAETKGLRRLHGKLAALRLPTAPAPAPSRASSPMRRALLRKEGDYWRLGWEDAEFRLRDRVGLRYLAVLVANPDHEMLAVDLVRTTAGKRAAAPSPDVDVAALTADLGQPRPLASAETTLDARAELAYRNRLHELQAVLEEARRQNDLGRIAAAEGERDALTREIARSLGLQGRGRDSRSPIERARISATRAIRAVIGLIRANDRSLGRHLEVTIKTGTFCSYLPDPELVVTWQL